MKRIVIVFVSCVLFVAGFWSSKHSYAQAPSQQKQRLIEFPDIPGYRTLKCDFHQHTVFSDGDVWPGIRVQEAIRDGLDAISITDHLEYQPHQTDLPHTDRNRSYQIALKAATGADLMVINGAEVTRDMPPGHMNAIFISDANRLIQDDVLSVCREAKQQGAFIFWNHPSWVAQNPTGIAVLTEMHRQLIGEQLIQGIEVVNEHTYSDESLQIGLENKLTLMGNSDIHGLIDWEYEVPENGHRPVTLIFAREKTEESLKEALFSQRTAVWHNNTLIGSGEFLIPLIQSSLTVKKVEALKSYKGNSFVQMVSLENSSDADYVLKNSSGYSLSSDADVLIVKAHAVTVVQVNAPELVSSFELRFKVLNAVTAPGTHPEIVFQVKK